MDKATAQRMVAETSSLDELLAWLDAAEQEALVSYREMRAALLARFGGCDAAEQEALVSLPADHHEQARGPERITDVDHGRIDPPEEPEYCSVCEHEIVIGHNYVPGYRRLCLERSTGLYEAQRSTVLWRCVEYCDDCLESLVDQLAEMRSRG